MTSFASRSSRTPASSPAGRAEAFSDLDTDVRQSIARIDADPSIRVKNSVRGFVHDLTNGTLREVK